MHFTAVELLRYGTALALEAGVFGLALHRGLYRRLRLFTIYLGAVAASDILRWIPILVIGLRSPETFWTYWGTQFVLIVLRGAVVFEICYRVLSPFKGVWRLAKGILGVVAVGLVTTALVVAEQRGPYAVRAILTAERGLELAIVGILLFALASSRYYRIPVDSLNGMVALGLGYYSAVQVVNNTYLNHWLVAYDRLWTAVRQDSFILASVIWLAALWKPLSAPRPAPVLLDSQVYSMVTPEVSSRLRELNARLEEILK